MKKIREWFASDGGKRWLRIASYLLIAVGAILLVIAGVNVGYRQWERWRLQARLTQTAPTPTIVVEPTAVSTAMAGQEPTATSELPGVTPEEGATPTLAAGVEPSPTQRAAATPTAKPTATPTRTTPSTQAAAAELPVRIVIPDLEIEAQVVEMGWKVGEVSGTRTSVWDTDAIRNGVAGHLINSALPGQAGNVVISGHHNIEGEVFKNISLAWDDDDAELQEDGITERSRVLDGRAIILHDAAGQEFTYIVEGMYSLPDRNVSQAQRLENGRFMAPTSEPTLTLVTCWPYTNNTHRIVVVARLAGTES